MVLQLIDNQNDFAIVYKPPNISTHQQGDSVSPALTSLLRDQFPQQVYFPVHRLDRVTSGLLILAKNETANSVLSQLFSSRQIEKIYLALSCRKPSKKQGLIEGDMVKARNGCWKLSRSRHAPAKTQFFSVGGLGGKRLFVLKPFTGKTHQLRVALKSLGSPILGDERYGGGSADRCYLHAYGLKFAYQGQEYCYEVAPKEGESFANEAFSITLEQLGAPFDLTWPAVRTG